MKLSVSRDVFLEKKKEALTKVNSFRDKFDSVGAIIGQNEVKIGSNVYGEVNVSESLTGTLSLVNEVIPVDANKGERYYFYEWVQVQGSANNKDVATIQPVPEPATMLLLGSGLIGLAGYGRKKFFKK